MLILSLVMSSILLAFVIGCGRSKVPLGTVFLSGIGCLFLPAFLGIGLPALLLQAFLLVVVAGLCLAIGWRGRRFLALSCLASLAAYGYVGARALQNVNRLLEQFPYVSMEPRLPPFTVRLAQPLPEQADQHLNALEELIDSSDPSRMGGSLLRLRQLEQLHEHTVSVFANRPGFGVSRMQGLTEYTLRRGLRTEEAIPQPGTRLTFTWSSGDLETPAPLGTGDSGRNWQMHSASILDFVNVGGFGYLKDRQHVAGFQGHQFSEAPTPGEHWILRSVDLVGLITHDRPVVYVTANLPRMEELRNAATRPLDDFETAGLGALRGGEDLFKRDVTTGRRLLGAIRSARQCVACHGGERGELLGAFSYTLTRDK
jgi:hypothetical protein